jgi:2-(1,2-epoxy-1,2-dihydrophenyl)acetyl-CoA isomerase
MACDFSIADAEAKCAFAFSSVALAPDMGSSVLLASRVGMPKATDLMMTGRRFTGREAADWGIFTDAVPASELEERVKRLAEKLAKGPSESYAAVKNAVNRAMLRGLGEGMEAETEIQNRLFRTPDHWEAVGAFLNKRAPLYRKEI